MTNCLCRSTKSFTLSKLSLKIEFYKLTKIELNKIQINEQRVLAAGPLKEVKVYIQL